MFIAIRTVLHWFFLWKASTEKVIRGFACFSKGLDFKFDSQFYDLSYFSSRVKISFNFSIGFIGYLKKRLDSKFCHVICIGFNGGHIDLHFYTVSNFPLYFSELCQNWFRILPSFVKQTGPKLGCNFCISLYQNNESD